MVKDKTKPIAKLFELPSRRVNKGRTVYGKIKTEILFIERCLDLLKPGGRMGIVLPESIYNNPSLLRVRQFVEDRAYLKAVVSLPEETAKAKENKDVDSRMALQKELREYLKQMDQMKADESRHLLKECFDYPIFMYEAEKVGLSATGEEDKNELYPNSKQPEQKTITCLQNYKSFLRGKTLPSANERILGKGALNSAFHVLFSECDRWDPISFCKMDWKWSDKAMQRIGDVLNKRQEPIDRNIKFSDLQPVTIHFDGSMDKRTITAGKTYSMQMFKAEPGDIIVSKIDLKNGAVGIVPDEWENVAVTGHFAVYSANRMLVFPEWIHRIIQQPDFKEFLWRHKVGAEGRKEVKLDFFESIRIPIPDLEIQAKILHHKQHIVDEIEKLKQQLELAESQVNQMIHGESLNL